MSTSTTAADNAPDAPPQRTASTFGYIIGARALLAGGPSRALPNDLHGWALLIWAASPACSFRPASSSPNRAPPCGSAASRPSAFSCSPPAPHPAPAPQPLAAGLAPKT